MRGFCCGACELEISSDEAPQQTEVSSNLVFLGLRRVIAL